ncbi:MAG: DNA mismatch repair endonuclease MutL [Planctomycetota bacterium]|jgi:DNA mismatch repair protein MutL
MGEIVVLDQNMVNMIAAGEVVERPASVVKELMENSIDAGATKITVSIEDGGRKLISVADNGQGMDAEDLAQALQPHTTSKIKTSSDLRGISTLGFRGEALASIASVAQVKAVSRTKDSTSANYIEIDCGNKADIKPCSADYGTTIQVRDLFYKLPARRKFLKTANTEMTHITEHFTRIALANNDLDMILNHNSRKIYHLSAKQGLHQRIAELFSSEISENLLETESSEKGLHIFALLARPNTTRTNNKFQYIFINGRFIRDKFISHAIKEAYRGCLEPNRYPIIFLFLQMPYEDYDVNVHPTKIEVRFYNANLVHSQILAKRGPVLVRDQKIADAMAEFFKKHRPIRKQQQFELDTSTSKSQTKYQLRDTTSAKLQMQRKFLQIQDSFIVAETDDGFIVIDQHALHERIIYESLCRRVSTEKLEPQKLLIPETFQITDAQQEAIKTHAELIEKLGIELAPFGPHTCAIQAFPTMLAKVSPLDFIQDLLDLLTEKAASLKPEKLLDEVLNIAACKAAIKAGQKLSNTEIEQLLAEKENIDLSSHCPHGRPTTIKFSIDQLEKQFKRT